MPTVTMARPLGRLLRFSPPIPRPLPSIFRRGHRSSPPPRATYSMLPVKSEYARLEYPKLEKELPAGISVSKTHFRVSIGNGDVREYLYPALRDSCKCPICVDPYSKQRNFRTSDIPNEIQPRNIEVDGKDIIVQWINDIPGYDASHTSRYDIDTLIVPVKSTTKLIAASRPRWTWDREWMNKSQCWISYDDYMNNEVEFAFAMRNLCDTGLIFVKDIPDSREEVEKLATRMGPLRNTFYGPTWDVRSVPKATNVAYTNQFLGFHMDLMYMREPPGYQLLHCLENSCDGGQSMFSDGFHAAKQIYKMGPELFDVLTDVQLCYEYNHEGAIYHNRWPVIETTTMRHSTEFPPIRHVNYSPPFQGPVHSRQVGRNYHEFKKFREALKIFSELLEREENTFELKLEPGQCVIFENRRVVHARRQFNTAVGQRWLAGAYVDEDSLWSRFRRSIRDYPEAWPGQWEDPNKKLQQEFESH